MVARRRGYREGLVRALPFWRTPPKRDAHHGGKLREFNSDGVDAASARDRANTPLHGSSCRRWLLPLCSRVCAGEQTCGRPGRGSGSRCKVDFRGWGRPGRRMSARGTSASSVARAAAMLTTTRSSGERAVGVVLDTRWGAHDIAGEPGGDVRPRGDGGPRVLIRRSGARRNGDVKAFRDWSLREAEKAALWRGVADIGRHAAAVAGVAASRGLEGGPGR